MGFRHSIRVAIHCTLVDRIKVETDGWTGRFAFAIDGTQSYGGESSWIRALLGGAIRPWTNSTVPETSGNLEDVITLAVTPSEYE